MRIVSSRSPVLAAAERRLDASNAILRGAGAPYATRVEVAPGVGTTNGNALVSRRIDIGGTLSARRRQATSERDALLAEVAVLRQQVVLETQTAYYDLVRARANETAARETVQLAEQVQSIIRRRVELGEAPTVQATRAEIEVARAEQETLRARAEAEARAAVLNRLLGRPREQPLTLQEGITLPEAPASSPDEMLVVAVTRRPAITVAQERLAARRGEVEVARSLLKPTLFAEVASDFWSLNRRPFRGNGLGIQARLSFPLGHDRTGRAEVERARASVAEGEAELEGVRRSIALEIEGAAATLSAAQKVARNYEQTLLPRTRELHNATRSGFESGLVSFLEVLEALRVLRTVQVERQNALFEALRARLALDAALGLNPLTANPENSAPAP